MNVVLLKSGVSSNLIYKVYYYNSCPCIWDNISIDSESWKGNVPLRQTYIITPKDHISNDLLYWFCPSNSGPLYKEFKMK